MHTPSIVKAAPGHAGGIFDVARAVRFRTETAQRDHGFLVLPGSPDWWRDALCAPTASQVAVEEGRVVGFIYAPAEAGGSVLKIDRIAVCPTHARRGIAQRLLEAAFAAVRPERAYAFIMHAPVRNQASISFFRDANGFRLDQEIVDAGLGAHPEASSFTWGRYVR